MERHVANFGSAATQANSRVPGTSLLQLIEELLVRDAREFPRRSENDAQSRRGHAGINA